MKTRTLINTITALGVCVIAYSSQAGAAQITEGFENTDNIFTATSTGGVPYDAQNALAAHSGSYSFLAGQSSCFASCFDSYRVDLTTSFTEPTMLAGVGLWALESSTSGTGWGGKMRIGHDSTWDLDWWGIIGNGHTVTGEWQYIYVPVNEMVTSATIQIFDLTTKSKVWIDDVVFDIGSTSVPEPETFWLFASGLLGLGGLAKKKGWLAS